MDKFKFWSFAIILFSSVVVHAQQVSPIPVFEKKIRDGTSIKMRSTELERVKREAHKVNSKESGIEKKIRFNAIKKDFEAIQKLQGVIINTYIKGKKINYKKIAKSAEKMTIKAIRLNGNLFNIHTKSLIKEKNTPSSKPFRQKSVKGLIIKLDNSIGKFVNSPIFKDLQIVDLEASKNAQNDLNKIINLSQSLFRLAQKNI